MPFVKNQATFYQNSCLLLKTRLLFIKIHARFKIKDTFFYQNHGLKQYFLSFSGNQVMLSGNNPCLFLANKARGVQAAQAQETFLYNKECFVRESLFFCKKVASRIGQDSNFRQVRKTSPRRRLPLRPNRTRLGWN
jgi:hypothetical protein